MTIKLFLIILGVWAGVWSVISTIACVYDKRAAKKRPRHRVRESTLLLLSALGGSVVMYLVMLLIRHKTKHIKFMLGIPLIVLAQAGLIAVVVFVLFPSIGVTW